MKVSSPTPASVAGGRILVTLAAVVWLLGTAVGTGILGEGGVESQAGGLLSDHATLIAPHGPAFSVWLVIYVGMAGYVVWQWLPRATTSVWASATRVPAAISLALNGIWLQAAFAGLLGVSVLVMAGILVSLCWIVTIGKQLPKEGRQELVWVQVTCGLYLGWICVATVANVAAWLVDLGVPPTGENAVGLTVVMLLVVVVLAAVVLRSTTMVGFQIGFTCTVAWGLAWVGVARLTGQLISAPVGWAAVAAAGLVLVVGTIRVIQRLGSAKARPAQRSVPQG